MGHQYHLRNWQNEDSSPVPNARALRYLLAGNSANNSSFVGTNNRNTVGGSETTTVQSIHEHINLHQLRGNGNTNTTIFNGHNNGGNYHYLAPIILQPTINIINYNDNHSSSSSSSSMPLPRLSESTLTTINGGQSAGIVVLYNNNNLSGGAAGNTRNSSNPILNNSRINNNVATVAASPIRNENLGRSLSFKRSRSPDQFSRGESSGQGSQAVGTSSRRQIIPHNMSSLTPSTLERHYSGNDVIPYMLNQNMTNQATAVGAGPSNATTSTTQSHINSLLDSRGQAGYVSDLPYHSNSTNESIDDNRFLFSPRQDHPSNNFIGRRYDPLTASASSFNTFAATRGSPGTTQAATSLHLHNNFMSSAARGGGSSFRSTNWAQNYSNNNNFDFFDSLQREIHDVSDHGTISIQEHVTVMPSGRVYRFLTPTRVHSYVPPQRPLTISAPSPSNYRLNPTPPPPRLGFSTSLEVNRNMQINSTLSRSENQVRLGSHNHIVVSTFSELMSVRNRLGDEHVPSTRRVNVGRRRVNVGLREEEILRFIQQETFQTSSEDTNTQNQTCTICQEDYVDGERIGRINCMHIYHLDCIKQWLLLRNVCPICRHTALEIGHDEDDRG